MTEMQPSPLANPSAESDGVSLPHEPEEIARQERESFRQASYAERGRLLAIACRSAARLDRSRREAGLPDAVAEPWPQSTWNFLKEQAARHVHR